MMMSFDKAETGDWRMAIDGDDSQSPVSNLQSQILVSYTLPAPQVTAADFLRRALGQARFYWQDGRFHVTFAGFGVAANLFAWGQNRFQSIREQAEALFAGAVMLNEGPALAAPRLFGGFAFRDDFMPDNTWSVHHPAHFILPHYQLVRVEGETWLTINALIPPDDDPEALRDELREALETRYHVLTEEQARMGEQMSNGNGVRCLVRLLHVTGHVLTEEQVSPAEKATTAEPDSITYPMSQEQWKAIINEAKARIAATELDKVVLSRVCEIRLRQRVDVDAALAYLKDHYTHCYRFLFEPRPFHAFYGATPELLADVSGATLRSMALAGSIRRSADPVEDEALGQALLNSAKDRHEHELVVMSMLNRLAPLTTQLEIAPQPGVYKLSNIQHLHTPVRGTLAEPQGILPIVELLHPTPALGGKPRPLALDFIREAEPVPRGWYAAPVGWIDYKLDGSFAVAIRSAVSQNERIWLYAGAGIVADSVPETEWAETALKFRPMLEAIGIEEMVNG